MKSLLFIVPSQSNGGTNSSLSAIYDALSGKYKVKTLILTSKGEGKYTFLSNSFTNNILNAYYNDFACLNGKVKFLALILKIFKRIALLLGFSIDDIVCKYAAGIIEKKENYDFIIGFQEGLAMRVASNFSNPNKYTWLHCDYERSVPSDKNEIKYYDKFKKIVCVSQYTMHRFLQRYPTLKANTYYIYNLLDDKNIIKLSSETIDDSRFDNSCFISTPSSGIFVQNESVVTKSYVQLILDTLYKINKTDIDKKMGKYIIAYYNIVNYLYQITLDYQALHPSIHGYITSINSYMHSQGYDFNNKFVIDEQNKSKSEYNINNKMYKQLDTMTKKDFVIQLKRFGESNYKFYHTQEEKNDKIDNEEYAEKQNISIYDDREIPLLLGSLIYDESWFKSTIDSEN